MTFFRFEFENAGGEVVESYLASANQEDAKNHARHLTEVGAKAVRAWKVSLNVGTTRRANDFIENLTSGLVTVDWKAIERAWLTVNQCENRYDAQYYAAYRAIPHALRWFAYEYKPIALPKRGIAAAPHRTAPAVQIVFAAED